MSISQHDNVRVHLRSYRDTKAVQLVGYDSDRYVSILNWIPRVEYRDMGTWVVPTD